MKYLSYNEKNSKVEISAPIFKQNVGCIVQNEVKFIQDGHEWRTTKAFPSIKFKDKVVQVYTVQQYTSCA